MMPTGLIRSVACLGLVALTVAVPVRVNIGKATDGCDSEIYCTGDLLKTVQLAEVYNDSKTFVDLSQIHDPSVTLANFKKFMEETNNKPNRTQVANFLSKNFVMQDELYNWTLPDWKENPSILKRVQDPEYREWAENLNLIWKKLARKMSEDVEKNPERHSLIYVKNPFIIPGGRFREFYYWDSYWIMQGLLLCEMHDTVKGMIENFAQMVDTYGFVPNGGRVYYLMRSQPPMLPSMVGIYLDYTGNLQFLNTMMPVLEKEFAYWEQHKTIGVKKNGKTYKLAHYSVRDPQPRPESYKEDYKMAQRLPEEKRENFYNDIKAGAESGWDFSNRWCIADQKNASLSLLNISTSSIVPVDLNAILQHNAYLLSNWAHLMGNIGKSLYYKRLANEYLTGIDKVLWNEKEGTWCDYDTKNSRPRCIFYPSNLTPLYTKSYDPTKITTIAQKSVAYLHKQKIDIYWGGTPTSLNYTGEQWDFPNAWPPLQSFVVEGLHRTGVKEAEDLATALASRWLSSNYIGFRESGKMYEKYDAVVPGEGGGGGEYTVQEGFGWTNGIIFQFLNIFPYLSPKTNDFNVQDPIVPHSNIFYDLISGKLPKKVEA